MDLLNTVLLIALGLAWGAASTLCALFDDLSQFNAWFIQRKYLRRNAHKKALKQLELDISEDKNTTVSPPEA